VSDVDERFMRRALELAAQGLGRTRPNPAVGCVVVVGERVVGEGYHHRAGEAHAEVLALKDAGRKAAGATAYVTLEPCSHEGRTPPCTDALLAAQVARVVYACEDCDERSAGKAAEILRSGGVEVTGGVLCQEAQRLNEAYFKHKRTGMPFVTLKMACSLDGKTATHTGDSQWISGEESRRRVHEMRNRADAVMVGVGTVLADDPQLTTRLPEAGTRDALRVIVDSAARTPPTARVVTPGEARCMVAVGENAPAGRVVELVRAGAQVLRLPPCTDSRGNSRVALPDLMRELGRLGVMSVMLEGGASLSGAMMDLGLVDKLCLFYAPRVIGGARALPVLGGLGVAQMTQARAVHIESVERVGEDILVTGYLCSPD
jgi:diaminohydroxyphosphoribosylaminopyrimidine deaminase/5-amino-6-(5-phosphoribosylamino)uracil reductase